MQELFTLMSKKKLVFWGTGLGSLIISQHLAELGFYPSYYVDNSRSRQQNLFQSKMVYNSERLMDEDVTSILVLVLATDYVDIVKQLYLMGFRYTENIIDGFHVFEEALSFGLFIEEYGDFGLQCLLKNKPYQNKHNNQRCFIIGNGPSINEQNLFLIKNELKIAVNSFYLHPQLAQIQPEYWIITDMLYWKKPADLLEPLLNALINKRINTKLFLPLESFKILESRAQKGKVDYNYFKMNFYQLREKNENINDVNFAKLIPKLEKNVILSAIMLALYFGCNEIYLLGCDHTWWSYKRKQYEKEIIPHFYSPMKINKTLNNLYTYEEFIDNVNTYRKQCEIIKEYAKQNGKIIYNATNGGCLDVFPKVKYETLF